MVAVLRQDEVLETWQSEALWTLLAAMFTLVHRDLVYGLEMAPILEYRTAVGVRSSGYRSRGLDAYYWLHTPDFDDWLAFIERALDPVAVRDHILASSWPPAAPRPRPPCPDESLTAYRRACRAELEERTADG